MFIDIVGRCRAVRQIHVSHGPSIKLLLVNADECITIPIKRDNL